MRHTLSRLPLTLLALGLAACGSLDNAPFQAGTVHGRLTQFDPAVALVSVMGAPDVRATVDAEGRFTLHGVPAGPAELFIVAAADKAARVPLTVQGGQSIQLTDVEPGPASTLSVKVHARGNLKIKKGQASVDDTPLADLPLDDDGNRRVGPLPDGCYTVSISAPDFPKRSLLDCVGGGTQKTLKVELLPDEAYASKGCAQTGCANDSVCAPDGKCVECLDDSACGASLVCRGFRCEGPGPQCAPCNGNWQCDAATHCEDVPGDEMACVAKCGNGRPPCGEGFTCQQELCLPDPAYSTTCWSYRQ
ncbi:carboxypeptidase regulatory-like domain-containing protein [Corallococcus sp. CA053C]|uniref:carboxypeptidase-like regulatory domain-containing protein n=1 Tax=Corallococcus sp. CA053C TaxID=2316732 RepID=UPI000EA055B1|nr:carboxypeptidase-like regulatory domain-containing protein [Corallococcus sp. CA053C]RKH14923.1 carboxypeptidase regulatory-like domain-containing protein [Corallococcus sp. CA053C]